MLPNSEWVLLAILAIILLKPEDIPAIAKFVGNLVKQSHQLWQILAEPKKHDVNRKKNPFHSAPQRSKIQPLKD